MPSGSSIHRPNNPPRPDSGQLLPRQWPRATLLSLCARQPCERDRNPKRIPRGLDGAARAGEKEKDAAEAKERAEAQERERARIAAEAEAASDGDAAEPPSEEAPPAVARGSRAPKRKDGKHESFDQKEKRSRKQRNECDWNQEEKRILRQTTDGYSLGY